MIFNILVSVSFIFQDTWSGGRDTSIIQGDTLKTFYNAFQIDPFSSYDTLSISRDSLLIVPSSLIFEQVGFEVKGIAIKSKDTLFVGILHPTSDQPNYKVFYTLDSLYFTSGKLLYDSKFFTNVSRMYYSKDYGNTLWIGANSGVGWIFYSTDLTLLPPQNFNWYNSGANVSGHQFADFLIYSGYKMYCSTNKGMILRYLKTEHTWQTIYRYPAPPGSEPNAQTLFKTKNGLGIAFSMADGSGSLIYETQDDVNFYPLCPLIPSKNIVGGVYSDKSKNLILAGNFPTAVYIIKNDTFYITFEDSECEIDYIFKADNGIIYLLAHSENTNPKRRIYASYDGIKWNLIENLDLYGNLGLLTPIRGIGYKKKEILVGTAYPPRLFKSKYQSHGYLTSNPIKIKGQKGPIKIKAYRIKAYPQGSFRVKFRTFKDKNMTDTISFSFIPPLYSDSSYLENYDYVIPGDSFIQYRVELFTSNPEVSPIVDFIKIYYEEDTIGPKVKSAVAMDGEFQEDGKDPDDHVLFVFDEPTSKPLINRFNVDSLFRLSNNHSWLNSYGDFGDAIWSFNGETLRIYLAFSGNNYPTVAPGDTVYVTMEDRFGFWNTSTAVIEGSFDDIFGPKPKTAIATDGDIPGDGIEKGDSLYLVFNEPTNIPFITPSNVDSFFYFKKGGFFGDSFFTQWITPETLCFIFTGKGSKIPITDTIGVRGYRISDIKGNPAYGEVPISGNFDLKNPTCDSIVASDNTFPDTSIDYDDFVAFYFSEDINTFAEINEININSILKLSNNHSWLSGNGKIGNILIYERFIFIFLSPEGGKPTVRPGDTVYFLNNFIFDLYGNPLSGKEVIRGSFTKINEKNIYKKPYVSTFLKEDRITLCPAEMIKEFKIYDIAGRNVSFNLQRKKEKLIIDLNKRKGIYFLIVKDKDERTHKFKILRIK